MMGINYVPDQLKKWQEAEQLRELHRPKDKYGLHWTDVLIGILIGPVLVVGGVYAMVVMGGGR